VGLPTREPIFDENETTDTEVSVLICYSMYSFVFSVVSLFWSGRNMIRLTFFVSIAAAVSFSSTLFVAKEQHEAKPTSFFQFEC
jgi:hypothetical protein